MWTFSFFLYRYNKGNSQIRRHSLSNLIFSPHYTQESINSGGKKLMASDCAVRSCLDSSTFFRQDLSYDKMNTWPLKRGWMRGSGAFKNAAVWGRLLRQRLRHKFGWCLSVSVLSQCFFLFLFFTRGDPEPRWALSLSFRGLSVRRRSSTWRLFFTVYIQTPPPLLAQMAAVYDASAERQVSAKKKQQKKKKTHEQNSCSQWQIRRVTVKRMNQINWIIKRYSQRSTAAKINHILMPFSRYKPFDVLYSSCVWAVGSKNRNWGSFLQFERKTTDSLKAQATLIIK